MKKFITSCFLLLIGFSTSFASEIHTFMNLGFSNDSKYFAFGNYGVNTDLVPYAELFVVDVAQNRFVSRDRHSIQGTGPIQVGQDGQNTMNRLVMNASAFLNQYKINPEAAGRLVYVLLNDNQPQETLEFTDFTTGDEYSITFQQKKSDQGASFSIFLRLKAPNSAQRAWEIGLPNFVRPGVENYRIRQIIKCPLEKSLIFVVEKRSKTSHNSLLSTYMIESVTINP